MHPEEKCNVDMKDVSGERRNLKKGTRILSMQVCLVNWRTLNLPVEESGR